MEQDGGQREKKNVDVYVGLRHLAVQEKTDRTLETSYDDKYKHH